MEEENKDNTKVANKTKEKAFAVGDHVFCWCSYLGVPFAYQQHGIVVEVNSKGNKEGEDGGSIVIMNFDYQEEEEEVIVEDGEATTDKTQGDDVSKLEQQRKTYQFNKASFASFMDKIKKADNDNAREETKEDDSDNNNEEGGEKQTTTTNIPQAPQQPQQYQFSKASVSAWFDKIKPDKNNNNSKEENQQDSDENQEHDDANKEAANDPATQQEKEQEQVQFSKASVSAWFNKIKRVKNDNDQTITSGDIDVSNSTTTTTTSDTTDTEENKKQLERLNSSLSTLFASAPDRPCTVTREVLSKQQAERKWDHVQYGQEWHKRLVSRAGTCSPAQPDPIPVVLLRIHFLQQHQDELLGALTYHHHKCNGENIVTWVKTGRFASFQGQAKNPGLHVGSFGMAASYAAIWGGQIAAAVLFPPSIPFLVAADVADVAHYSHNYKESKHIKQEWDERTQEWNDKFSKYLLENGNVVEQVQEKLLLAKDATAVATEDAMATSVSIEPVQ